MRGGFQWPASSGFAIWIAYPVPARLAMDGSSREQRGDRLTPGSQRESGSDTNIEIGEDKHTGSS